MTIELPSPPGNVCIIRLSAIGDTCHTLPVVRTLMKAWPDTRFSWVIGKVEATLMAGIDGLEFIIFDKSKGIRAYAELRRAVTDRFDVLLHMHASMRANLASLLIPSDIRLGFDRARARDYQWLFTNRKIAAKPNQHVMDGLFGFAEAFGIAERVLRWDIPVSAADRDFAATHVNGDRPSLVISPCSSQRFRNFRNWSAENYADVADYAARRYGAQVIMTGASTALELEYGTRIAELCREAVPLDLIGKTTLKQLLSILDAASAVICPDSGPAHMANSVKTPVIGLYASSNKGRTGPYFYPHLVVDKYPQAVAGELGKSVEEMPWGGRVRNPDVMSLITLEDVTAKVDEVLTIAGCTAEKSLGVESSRDQDSQRC